MKKKNILFKNALWLGTITLVSGTILSTACYSQSKDITDSSDDDSLIENKPGDSDDNINNDNNDNSNGSNDDLDEIIPGGGNEDVVTPAPDRIINVAIAGDVLVDVGETLSLFPNITVSDNTILEGASVRWEVTKDNNQKTVYDTYVLNISDISLDYNNALVKLIVTIDGKDYCGNINITVINSSQGETTYITLKNNEAFANNVSNIIASSIWNNAEKIKELILSNSNTFFNISDSFNLEQNLNIVNIVQDSSNSDAGYLYVNIVVNNATSEGKQITTQLKISGFKTSVDTSIPLKDYDYFVLPGKDESVEANKITNPFTQNNNVINKWGNAPLPWRDDELITEEDIMNMFTYLTLYAKGRTIKFGQRKIDSNLFADSYVKWIIKYRKYFPYKSFDNPPPHFIGINAEGVLSTSINMNVLNTDEYINKTQWWISQVTWTNFDEVYEEGNKRDEYLRFVNKLFRYVQPNMTDVEKLFLCTNFTSNWLWYSAASATSAPYDNAGVCADYANLLSFALSILDVPSFAVECGMQANPHAIVWTYLDLDGSGTKKWYASDTTNSDQYVQPYDVYEGLAALSVLASGDKRGYNLFDVGVSQFSPTDGEWRDDISNCLYGLPWSTIGQNKSSIGLASYGENNNYPDKYFSYLFLKKGEQMCTTSRNFYINGQSYYFVRDGSKTNGVTLYKRDLLINSQPEEVSIDLPDTYKSKFTFETSFNKDNVYPPLVQQYGNKIVILANGRKPSSTSANNRRSLLVIETTDTGINWNSVKEFPIDSLIQGINLNSYYIFNFDVGLDGQVRLDCGEKFRYLNSTNVKTVTVDLGQEFKNEVLFGSNNNNRKGDLLIAKQYYSALISAFRINDNKTGYISFKERADFYDLIDNEIATSTNYYDSILKIQQRYDEICEKIFATSAGVIPNKVLNDYYVVAKSGFDSSGFDFNNLNIYNNPDDMISISNAAATYDIYYSSTRPSSSSDLDDFTKIVADAKTPKIDNAILSENNISSADGYYYISIKTKESLFNTNVCQIEISDNHYQSINFGYYSSSIPSSGTTRVTNYSDNIPNWYDDPIAFNFDIYLSPTLYGTKYEYEINLKYINVDTKEISTVKDNNYFTSNFTYRNGTIKGKIDLQTAVTSANHGIYFIEITTTNKTTHASFKNYSLFQFIMTQNDYDEWDKTLWMETVESYIKTH